MGDDCTSDVRRASADEKPVQHAIEQLEPFERLAVDGGARRIDRLGAAVVVALIAAFPVGIGQALPAFTAPILLAAARGVGISSSVIPYVCDQLAMASLPRATFPLLLSLLSVTAATIGYQAVCGSRHGALAPINCRASSGPQVFG